MEIIEDIPGNEDILLDSIKKYGSAPEHNFWYFLNIEDSNGKCRFFRFNGNIGIMAQFYKNGSCEMVSEVLAPENKKAGIFQEFLQCALSKMKQKKAFVFVPTDFRNEINAMARDGNYRLSRQRTYHSPIFSLEKLDERLPGKSWKKIRNIRNSFYKKNKVEVLPSNEVSKKLLVNIVLEWKKNKNSYGRADFTKYLNFIENDFRGTKHARTLIVNGKPSTITAGWSIPNRDVYYSAIGIHDYGCSHLGEIVNLDDLLFLKSKGNRQVNFGTSDKPLLSFKKKFNPDLMLKYHYFSIRIF